MALIAPRSMLRVDTFQYARTMTIEMFHTNLRDIENIFFISHYFSLTKSHTSLLVSRVFDSAIALLWKLNQKIVELFKDLILRFKSIMINN